jgi:hypothetical protein
MKDDYKPKPGHVWRYQDGSWVEVPEIKHEFPNCDLMFINNTYQPQFEGPIEGFSGKLYKVIDGDYHVPDTLVSYDATREFLSRALHTVGDATPEVWSAIRFYEDVLLYRAFTDVETGRLNEIELFRDMDVSETNRLRDSFNYIEKMTPEELCDMMGTAIEVMSF